MNIPSNVFVCSHPLIQHKLSILRDKNTQSSLFRTLLDELSACLLYEATRDLRLKDYSVETPLMKTTAKKLDENIMLCPILRAGLGMSQGALKIIPNASVGFLGFVRDEKNLKVDFYFQKLPNDAKHRSAIVLDPMFATGTTALEACKFLKQQGIKKLKFVCILASLKGLQAFEAVHNDIEVFTACVDKDLNDKGYIIPGLGDAGDRIFDTEDK